MLANVGGSVLAAIRSTSWRSASMPALNGVQTEVVITWGTKPFTRVVGTEDGPNGWKWYVHENGTRSTTVMLETNGVPSPTGLVADPTPVLPTREEIPAGRPKPPVKAVSSSEREPYG